MTTDTILQKPAEIAGAQVEPMGYGQYLLLEDIHCPILEWKDGKVKKIRLRDLFRATFIFLRPFEECQALVGAGLPAFDDAVTKWAQSFPIDDPDALAGQLLEHIARGFAPQRDTKPPKDRSEDGVREEVSPLASTPGRTDSGEA